MGINEQNEITRGRETIVGWMLIFQSEVLIVINERTVDIRQQIYYFHNLASKRWWGYEKFLSLDVLAAEIMVTLIMTVVLILDTGNWID